MTENTSYECDYCGQDENYADIGGAKFVYKTENGYTLCQMCVNPVDREDAPVWAKDELIELRDLSKCNIKHILALTKENEKLKAENEALKAVECDETFAKIVHSYKKLETENEDLNDLLDKLKADLENAKKATKMLVDESEIYVKRMEKQISENHLVPKGSLYQYYSLEHMKFRLEDVIVEEQIDDDDLTDWWETFVDRYDQRFVQHCEDFIEQEFHNIVEEVKALK